MKKPTVLLVVVLMLLHQPVTCQDLPKADQSVETGINKWRLSGSVGYGWRVANFDGAKDNLMAYGFSSSAVDDYIKDIKSGYKIAGQVHYMMWGNFGLGVDYNFFHSSAGIAGYVQGIQFYNSHYIYLKVEDNVFTNYVGASAMSESRFGNDKFRLGSQFSLGYTMYREELLFNQQPTLVTANALGMNLEINIEYFIISKLSVGAGMCYFLSSVNKLKVDDGHEVSTIDLGEEERESLNRLDASISINYYF